MKSSFATWRITGSTVRGAIHLRRGTPNQDAIAWRVPSDPAAPRILAIADGHGAPLHIRSHRGARLAVRAAISELVRFGESYGVYDLPDLEVTAATRLTGSITTSWQTLVSDDLGRRPLANWELDNIAETVPASGRMQLERRPHVAYGSTLIAALLTPAYALLLQLGDGDILEVDDSCTVRHPPLPPDPLLHGGETTSLCSPDAHEHVRVCVIPVGAETPSGFMLSTDGYANSFIDAYGLEQAALDLFSLSHDIGMVEVGRALPGWLRTTSAQGSGDDITVGLAVRQ